VTPADPHVRGQTPPPADRLWHAKRAEEVARTLSTRPDGLSEEEAAARLKRDGPNQLPEQPPTSALVILLHQFRSPLIYILVVATIVTLLLAEYIDAAVIAAVLALNALIGYTQERRAENSVRALMQLMSPRARVRRAGRERDVESRDLVRGDVVLLESGVRVPADLRLFSTTALRVDESLLTGESLPVTKTPGALESADAPLADRTNMAYMATVVASGRAQGYVVATAVDTAVGGIAESIRTEIETDTPLQHRMARFAHFIGLMVAASAALAFGIGLWRGEPASHMFMVAVALAVASVPEGLPVVLTITLALGVRRMARRRAIVRRLPAVETLGSTTVIGSDKTGTLTENRMTVREIWAGGRALSMDQAGLANEGREPRTDGQSPIALTLAAGVLTNEASVYLEDGRVTTQGDPTEAALLVSATVLGHQPDALRAEYDVVDELPFEPERQYSASLRRRNGEHVLFVKGAPERLLSMCTSWLTDQGERPLDEQSVHAAAREMASRGLRVLGMAYRRVPGTPESLPQLGELVFLGLQGMMDPPRAGVLEAIRGCQDAGIRVVMITGDHAETALAIGRQLEIATDGAEPLTGRDLEHMPDTKLRERVGRVTIYARVAPEHKLRVVQALRGVGEVVAVTGDGVNDAPALKAADIGISMGRSGTDVAREASDMVLADDNFVSIHAAVEEGRVTFDNLRKATFFLVSTGAASIVMILTALGAGWPLPMVAAQLLWLNLVTNGLQDMALAFEPGEPDVLQRPPRPRAEGVMSSLLWERTAVAGIVMAAGTLMLFRWELTQDASLVRAQTVALTTMVLFQMFHVGNCRSEHRSIFAKSPLSNPFLFLATAAALLLHVGALSFAPTQLVLRVEPLDGVTWLRILVVAASIIVAMEVHKLARQPRRAELSGPPRGIRPRRQEGRGRPSGRPAGSGRANVAMHNGRPG
jgi:calcium-translocating P-type ATPase